MDIKVGNSNNALRAFIPGYPICQGCEHLTAGENGWYCSFKPGTQVCAYPERMPPPSLTPNPLTVNFLTAALDLVRQYDVGLADAATAALAQIEAARNGWCKVAMDMINELRQDYAPGELGELDGVRAIHKLRAAPDEARTVIQECFAVINRRDGWNSATEEAWKAADDYLRQTTSDG
jgi:hypothetical protein